MKFVDQDQLSVNLSICPQSLFNEKLKFQIDTFMPRLYFCSVMPQKYYEGYIYVFVKFFNYFMYSVSKWSVTLEKSCDIWVKVFKNGPSKICGDSL